MPNIFDGRGIITQSLGDFRKDMTKQAEIIFADKLEGRTLRADDSSILGRLFSIVSRPLTQNAQILPLILQSLDINSAEGQQLDNLLWGIHRVKRKGETQSTGLVLLNGDIGTTVSKGSSVSNNLTGDVFTTDSEVTFSNTFVNGVDIEIDAMVGTFSFSYEIEGLLSKSAPVNIENTREGITKLELANRFVDIINSQSGYLFGEVNNDKSIKIKIADESMIGNFLFSPNVSVVRSYSPVYVTSKTFNVSESKSNEITVIRTPILGWRGVTNPYYLFPSTGIESDEDYRSRGKLFQSTSYGKYTSIIMALKSVRGVVYENIQQNTSKNTTNSGIINNGISTTVMGGNEDDIALALFNSISEGIMTSGDIVKVVKDINGFGHVVRFSRPKIVPLEITMSLITYPDFPNNGLAIIRQAIVEWFNNLNVGEDIHYSRLYEPINSIKGFAVKNLKFGYEGGTLGLEDIVIRHNEIATISATDISIGGNNGSGG